MTRVTFVLALAALILAAVPARAQITPPKPGVEFPPGYYEQLGRHKDAFQFKRAWKAETERVRRHREQLLRDGVLSDPYTDSDLQDQLYDGPNSTGTITDYYDEVSYGYLNLTGDVIGAQGGGLFQVANNDTYYKGPPGCNGLCGSANTGEYLQELLDAGDPWVDFAQYDNDGPDGIANSGDDDGYVDFVAFVHPESGGECGGNNLWSHRWVYEGWWGSAYTTNDPAAGGGFIRVSDYTIQPLLSCDDTSIIEIGVFSHEYGHAFGLPDLYDTDSGNGSSAGVGEWCLMGSGSWGGDGGHPETPSHMSAWCKEQLGWVDPIVVCQDQGLSIPAAADTGVVLKVYPHGTLDNEYFLIENRVQTGFDTWIHESGFAIWHIDNDQSGNADETHKLVDLEEADGLGELDNSVNRGDAGDVFPGSASVMLFDDDTTPDARDYSGVITGFSAFNFGGAADPRTLDVTVTECQLAVGDVIVNDAPCGNNSGALDGNELANLGVGLRNDFPGDITGVSGVLTSLTAGVNVLQGNVTFGTVVCGVLNYGDVELEIEATGPLADGGQVDFQIDLTGDGGYTSSATFSIYAGNFVVLLEDDGSANNASLFQNAITGAGYAYVHQDNGTAGLPSLGLLEGALAVVWYTGIEGFNTLNSTEQALVQTYLDGGGSLFISGQDLGWGLVEQGSAADELFYETYLHADYVADTSNDNTLNGLGGDPIGDGLSLNLTGGTGANNSTWPSWISPRSGASSVFEYSVGRPGAIRYETGHNLVYFAFNFEAINTSSTRTTTMQRVLDRIVPADLIAPSVNLTSPAAGDTLGSCGVRTITWTATDNDQVDEVDLLYSDDSGESWNLIAAALPNPGSYGWSQPGLSGNTFRIKVLARDPGGRQGFDMNAGDFTVELGLPAVAVDSPNGGEAFGEFEPVPVTWAMSDSCSGALDSTRVYISVDGGSAWSYVGTALAPDTSVVWGGTDVPTDSGLVRVMVHDDQGRTGTDIGDGFFSVLDQASPTVTVLAPNGGETAQGGIILSLDADATDNVGVDSVCVSYSTDGGSNWVEIECGAVSFPYSWNTPMVDSDSCLIRVSAWDAAMNTAFDQSDSRVHRSDQTGAAAEPPQSHGVHHDYLRFLSPRGSPGDAQDLRYLGTVGADPGGPGGCCGLSQTDLGRR
jgi:M6 family metalloprotease-like protein